MEGGTGGSLAEFSNGIYLNALQFIYTDANQNIGVAYTTDGTHYSYSDDPIQYNGIYPEVGCGRGLPDNCIPATAVFQGHLYLAYIANSCQCLNVLEGTPIPNNVAFTWTQVYTSSQLLLTSSPEMAVTPDGDYLVIRYGTTNQNAAYSTTLNTAGAWNTYNSNSYAPTRSALVAFNGSLYAIDKQNNSDNGVFVAKLDDNGVVIPGTGYQVSGWTTKLGLSATVWNGEIVVAGRVNSSSNTLQIYVSTNGTTWYGKSYTGHSGGGDYAVFTYNNGTTTGLADAVVANDSSNYMYANFATY